MKTKTALVISHAECTDGLFAAWAADYHLRRAGYTTTIMFTKPHVMPEGALNKKWDIAFIVDVAPRPEDFITLVEWCDEGAFILDHHATNRDDYAAVGLVSQTRGCYFDMTRSGAGLAWDEVQRRLNLPQWTRLAVLDYVEDRDLWRFNRLESRKVNAGIMHTFKTLDDIRRHEEGFGSNAFVATMAAIGHTVLEVQEAQIQEVTQSQRQGKITIDGVVFTAVNSPLHQSEIGSRLAPAVVWYVRDDNRVQLSFRSKETLPDVSVIAKSLGGGGHRNAAGAQVSLEKWISILQGA